MVFFVLVRFVVMCIWVSVGYFLIVVFSFLRSVVVFCVLFVLERLIVFRNVLLEFLDCVFC